MLRRSFASLCKKTFQIGLSDRPVFFQEKQLLLLSKGKTGWPFSFQSFSRFADLPRGRPQKRTLQFFKKDVLVKEPWWYWKGGGWYPISAVGWYGGLKSIARRFRSQALESYCLWHGPLLKSLRGAFWPAERWLLVTGVLRNSRSWVPSFAIGTMRPERWMCVAMVTSLNTVGAHIPRMSLLLLAQILAKTGSADAPSRDAYFPLQPSLRSPIASSSRLEVLLAHVWNELCIWLRLCRLTFYFLPLFLMYPLTSLNESLWRLWLRYLRHSLESCGPAFIKWGQWASTRRDLFAPDVSLELRKLQTESPAHSGEASKEAIESAFGLPVDSIFDEFEDVPIASGSIGQVHKAKLSPIGATVTGVKANTEVAIKVRHPNVDEAFQRDMKLMLWIAQFIDRCSILQGFNLHEIICQFAAPMSEQVDLCIEAANLQCFRHNFRRNERIIFPEPLFPLVTSDILVETYHRGVSVQDLVENTQSRESVLAELGSATFFDMVVKHNLLHADLHPGNILVKYTAPKTKIDKLLEHLSSRTLKFVTPELWNPLQNLLKRMSRNKEPCPSIILLDAGMATQLTEKERFHMLGLFRSVAELDGEAAAEHTLSFAGAKQSCPDPEGFRQDMLNHFALVSRPDWSEEQFETNVDAFGHVIDIIRQHRVTLPGQIVSCLFTVFLLEGWASKLDPDHSIMSQIKSLLKKLDWSLEKHLKDGAQKVLVDGISNLSLQVSAD